MESRPLLEIALLGLLLAALAGLALGRRMRTARPEAHAWRPRLQDDQSLADALRRIARKHGQPAMAAALVRGDAIVARAAVGTLLLGSQRPVSPDARFHVGSTTKGMTALLLATLVRDGKLRWDDTLGALLPDLAMRDEYKQVGLRDLLLHRAGVLAMQAYAQEEPALARRLWHALPAEVPDPPRQRLELARLVLSLPPVAPPGARHLYSNVGFALLGAVAERAASESFEALLANRLFVPLGMRTTRLGGWPASPSDPEQPRGQNVEPGGLRPQALDDEYVFPAWMNPSGGVHCSIEDYARYARENLQGLRGKGSLLDLAGYREIHAAQARVRLAEMYEPSLRAMAAAHAGDIGQHTLAIGYGWVSVATAHGDLSASEGSGGTFFARIVVFPALDAALVAVTSTGGGAGAINQAIERVSGLAW